MKILPRFLSTFMLILSVSAARAQSPFGQALALNGVNQYVVVPTAAASAISNAFTIEAWVNPGADNSWSRLMDFGDGPGTNNIICALSAGATGQPNLSFYVPANQNLTAPSPLPLNVWTHVAFTYDGTNGSIYVNGVLAARSPMLPPPPATRTNDYIGRSNWSGDGYTEAVIDDFRIWKVAQTQAEIQSQFATPLKGNESGLLLYYRFNETNGIVATNSATAGGAAFNGTLVNSPAWVTSTVPIVTSSSDSGPGSLRQIVAGVPPGAFITFATNLSGQAIQLTNGPIVLSTNVTIDGSALAKSVRLDGHHTNSIFTVNSGAVVALNWLTITNGNAGGADGGGIFNAGNLTLNQCMVVSNVTRVGGGGACNFGVMTVNASTFVDNESQSLGDEGGGIDNFGTLTVNQSTFVHNSANGGGAIFSEPGSLLAVVQSTICSNTAFCCGGGITIYSTNSGQTLLNSIVAGNANGDFFSHPFDITENNLTDTNPMLLPLGNYGGPTPTMPPASNSPAIDNGNVTVGGNFATDQRGFPRFNGSFVDIGAVESQYPAPRPAVVTLPATEQTSNTATLNGTVSARGSIATCYFQYGTTTNYGSNTVSAMVTNSLAVPVSAAITGLSPAMFYHFRLVASNFLGIVSGNDEIFTTDGATNLVTNTRDDGSAGSLRAVLAGAGANDTINFAPALSGETIRLTNGEIALNKNLTIDGSALAKKVQLNGNHAGGIFVVLNGITITLNSLVLTNSSLVLEDALSDAVAKALPSGSAVDNFGTLAMNDCTLAGNSDGAIVSDGPLTLIGCTLDRNFASYGGAIEDYSTCLLSNCTFSGNSATSGWGGAILNYGMLTLNASTFADNFANAGGAVFNESNCLIYNCTFYSNRVANAGGAFFNDYNPSSPPTASMLNCTFFGNSATNGGGGVFNNGSVSFTNTIIAGNSGGDVFVNEGTVTAGGGNIVETIFNFGTFLGQDTILAVNPQLAPPGNYGGPTATMPPLPGSPAVDNGVDFITNTLATDQRGFPRLFGLHVDIGAVELVYTPAAPSVVTLPASDRTLTTAVLNGTVARNGEVPTAYYFQYGTNTSYGLATGTNILEPGAFLVSAPISGLMPDTIYHYRLVATNQLGRTPGNDVTFQSQSLTGLVTNARDDGSAGCLRTVVGNTAAGGTVYFATNLSGQTIRLTAGQITLNEDLVIDASALPKSIYLNGSSNSCIFFVSNAAAVLNWLVITNGYNNDNGVDVFSGTGSGIGGGIVNQGTLAINNCVVSGNGSVGDAGGIENDGVLTASNCTIAANFTDGADWGGAGIENYGTLTLHGCTISGNWMPDVPIAEGSIGGGILNWSNLVVNNSTIANNACATDGFGGGIFNAGGLAMNNCTVVSNSADPGGSGGGIYSTNNFFGMVATNTLNLTNTIVAGNNASNSPDLYGSLDGLNNFIGGNPQLAPLGNYGGPTQTMPPLPGSPVIDAGDDSVTSFLAIDQRGQPRLIGANVDIGADEANPQTLIVQISGNGTVAPDLNGQILTNGQTYSMTATAGPSFAFTNWTAGTNVNSPFTPLTNHATLKFEMQPNLILQANFRDLVNPTLQITNLPAVGGMVTDQLFTVEGWARDNVALTGVFYRLTNHLSDTGWLPASSTNNYTNWWANLVLAQGTNTISAYAVAAGGNVSATSTIKFDGDFLVPDVTVTGRGGAVALKANASSAIPRITSATKLDSGAFALTFTGDPDTGYQVFSTTNFSLSPGNWTSLGTAVESPAGSQYYQFTDSQMTNDAQRFYRVGLQ